MLSKFGNSFLGGPGQARASLEVILKPVLSKLGNVGRPWAALGQARASLEIIFKQILSQLSNFEALGLLWARPRPVKR